MRSFAIDFDCEVDDVIRLSVRFGQQRLDNQSRLRDEVRILVQEAKEKVGRNQVLVLKAERGDPTTAELRHMRLSGGVTTVASNVTVLLYQMQLGAPSYLHGRSVVNRTYAAATLSGACVDWTTNQGTSGAVILALRQRPCKR